MGVLLAPDFLSTSIRRWKKGGARPDHPIRAMPQEVTSMAGIEGDADTDLKVCGIRCEAALDIDRKSRCL
jgi:hypothetical protein